MTTRPTRLTGMDDGSGVSSFTYDFRDEITRVRSTITGKHYVFDYDWDSAGRLKQITYPTGRIVTYMYDSFGRPTRVLTQQSGGAQVNLPPTSSRGPSTGGS